MQKSIKNILNIILIVVLTILLFNTKVRATESQVQLIGESIVKEGQQVMTIKINNDEKIGVVGGCIKGDDNIESIEVAGSFNGWTITYNNETGEFNTLNAAGINNGEVLQLKYKVKDTKKGAKITLSNIELTTISYDTIKISETITKEITVNSTVENNKIENNNSEQNQVTNNTPTKSSTENKQNKITKVNDKTTSATSLPKAGSSYIIVIFLIGIAIIGIFCYMRYSAIRKNVK